MTNLSLLIFTPNISELFNIIISISKPLEQAHHKQKRTCATHTNRKHTIQNQFPTLCFFFSESKESITPS